MYQYQTKGTCSRQINLDIHDGIIQDIEIVGGCDGNLKGIAKLVCGKDAIEVAQQLEGISCGTKKTSCPDQIAIAIRQYLAQMV